MYIFNFNSHNTESKLGGGGGGGGGEGTSTPKSSTRNLRGTPMTKVHSGLVCFHLKLLVEMQDLLTLEERNKATT